jgi:hypothetical protein
MYLDYAELQRYITPGNNRVVCYVNKIVYTGRRELNGLEKDI